MPQEWQFKNICLALILCEKAYQHSKSSVNNLFDYFLGLLLHFKHQEQFFSYDNIYLTKEENLLDIFKSH